MTKNNTVTCQFCLRELAKVGSDGKYLVLTTDCPHTHIVNAVRHATDAVNRVIDKQKEIIRIGC